MFNKKISNILVFSLFAIILFNLFSTEVYASNLPQVKKGNSEFYEESGPSNRTTTNTNTTKKTTNNTNTNNGARPDIRDYYSGYTEEVTLEEVDDKIHTVGNRFITIAQTISIYVAMVAMIGFFFKAMFTGKTFVQSLLRAFAAGVICYAILNIGTVLYAIQVIFAI